MKARLGIRKLHYSVCLELSDEGGKNLEEAILQEMSRIDEVIRQTSRVWHFGVRHAQEFVDILPNGRARFHPAITNKADQLILLMEAEGTVGVSALGASKLLNLPTNTITGYYGKRSTKNQFRRLGELLYCLTPLGLKRFRCIVEMDELTDLIATSDQSD